RPKELVTSIIARATRARQLSTMITNLSISEARFRSVCESAKDAIVSSDKQGRIVTWNRGAENLFGYTETEIQGSPFTQLFSDNYRESLQNFGQLNEVVALKKDKRECPVDISQSNWTVGKHQFFTRIIRDVSSRKKYEQSLREAKITADNANRAKSEFLSAMSHELRTPLNAIMGFSQVLTLNAEQPLSEYQTECIDYIIKGGQHLLLLIDDILDLAKIESGKIDISLENIQINTLIKECIPLVQPLADKHNIHIQQTTTSDIPLMVKADNTRLKQVLLNLLSNAVKYNHDGGSVTISYELRSAALLRINVADTGIGIPEGKAHELFQPFCRLGAEATNVEGTGIGLSVSKRLVETMAGAIGFENSSQGGSIFWVELPLADTRKENNQTQTATTKNQTAFPDMTGTLLYVEDNPSNLSLIEMIVTHIEGLVLISACNAELGIELARSQQPNLIMLDINLPGMNGFEALAKLRDTEETAHIPVIALSAAATTREIEKGMSAGFHNYITKPLQVNDVITTIQALL
ncbi:MAG: PAS domain S-box protein, partial [Spongiibacteraceae bacterium]|nr:PAS domain S-box protein [Spongiibacteraceae bacterium]